MDKRDMGRKLKLFSILSLSSTLLIGCGDGFRSAIEDAKKVSKAGGTNQSESLEEQLKRNEQATAAELEKSNTSGDQRTVQQNIEEEIAKKKAADEAAKAAADKAAADKAAEGKTLDPKDAAKDVVQDDSKDLKVSFKSETTVDEVKQDLMNIKPELADYLKGLTITVNSPDGVKLNVEVLAVISKAPGKISRIMSRQVIPVEGDGKSTLKLMQTDRIKLHSAALMVAQSGEEMYEPSENTKAAISCAEAKCESAILVLRTATKKKDEDVKILSLVLELKRHGDGFEISRSNASEKPLMTKSYHEAE